MRDWRKGQAISAERLNEIQQAILQSIRVGSGLKMTWTGGNLVISIDQKQVNPYYVQMRKFKIVSIHDDHLICNPYNAQAETVEDVEVPVAKYFHFQKTPYHGETIDYPDGQSLTYTYTSTQQRTVNDGSDDYYQQITPEYYVGEIIQAVNGVDGTTGVTVTIDGVDQLLNWEEIPARVWGRI